MSTTDEWATMVADYAAKAMQSNPSLLPWQAARLGRELARQEGRMPPSGRDARPRTPEEVVAIMVPALVAAEAKGREDRGEEPLTEAEESERRTFWSGFVEWCFEAALTGSDMLEALGKGGVPLGRLRKEMQKNSDRSRP